jgi:hypothetical protein
MRISGAARRTQRGRESTRDIAFMPAPSAVTITVREVVDLLDGNFASLAEGVAQRR